jgi:hypothetical protein
VEELGWYAKDSQGVFMSGSAGGPNTVTANRAPVGTPVMQLNGNVVFEYGACDDMFLVNIQGTH